MTRLLSSSAAAIVSLALAATVFAAEAEKPIVPAPPILASQPAASNDTKVVKELPRIKSKKAARLNDRRKKAKENTKSLKAAPPVEAVPVVTLPVK